MYSVSLLRRYLIRISVPIRNSSSPIPQQRFFRPQTRNFCREFSKVTDSRTTEYYLEDRFGDEDPLEDLRNYLYPKSSDSRVNELSSAETVDDVFRIIEAIPPNERNHEHAAQSLSTLYYLKKYWEFSNDDDPFEGLTSKAEFRGLVARVEGRKDAYDLDTLSYLFLSLRRLSVALSDPRMQRIQIHLQNRFGVMSLTSLSYFSVALRGKFVKETPIMETSLTWGLTLSKALPRIKTLLERIENAQEMKNVAICFNSASRIVSDELMELFAEKVIQLIDEGKMNDDAGNLFTN